MQRNHIIYVFIILFNNIINITYADSINKDIDLDIWSKRTISPPKKACADCNFFISFPLENEGDNNLFNNIKNIYKIIFVKTDIKSAYQEIIKHKAIMSCMYCGDLDIASRVLPEYEKIVIIKNITYNFIPMQDSYKIEIRDNICGIVDTLLFMQDSNGSVLWVTSILNCPNK